MILPFLVILLVAVSVYLSFQKGLNLSNQLVVIGLAVLALCISYNFIKSSQNLVKLEGFTDYENRKGELELFSPPYGSQESDDEQVGNKVADDVEYEIKPVSNTEKFKESKDEKFVSLDELSNHNFMREEKKVRKEKFNDNTGPQMPRSSIISQSGMKGTGNIFTPQIIIKNEDDSQSIEYKDSPSSKSRTIYHSRKPTKDNDVWNESNGSYHSKNGSYDAYYDDPNDPWDNMEKNMKSSYAQHRKNQEKCGGAVCPHSDRKDAEELAKSRAKGAENCYHPGYSFMPPTKWDIPQPRPPVCVPDRWKRPSAVFDRGTPTNVLELDEDGNMLMSENEVTFTNVGSILPKFKYEEVYNY